MFGLILTAIVLGSEGMVIAIDVPTVEFDPKVLIVNGESTKPNEFPWQVRLLSLQHGSASYHHSQCGGSLIAKDLVITAAHCVYDLFTQMPTFEPKDLRVITGDHDTRRKDPFEQSHKVKEVIVHPNAIDKRQQNMNDIALIVMESSIECTAEVNIIALPWKSHAISLVNMPPPTRTLEEYGTNPECYTTGWGNTYYDFFERAAPAYVLQKLQRNKILSELSECNNATYGNETGTSTAEFPQFVNSDEFCTPLNPEEVKGSCQTDSGGPLFCKIKDHWELVGITTRGVGGAICAHSPGMT